jgi:hypothetical protein
MTPHHRRVRGAAQDGTFPAKLLLPSAGASLEIADLVLPALFVGKPSLANQLLGFPPMVQGAAFRATLFLPNGAGQRCYILLFPGFHNH